MSMTQRNHVTSVLMECVGRHFLSTVQFLQISIFKMYTFIRVKNCFFNLVKNHKFQKSKALNTHVFLLLLAA